MFVGTDIHRLKQNVTGRKPLICIGQNMEKHNITYIGLGYSVTYEDYLNVNETDKITYIEDSGDGVIIRLLGITVWSVWT